ncbi:hypothetical protein [Streptomyces cyaneofuscatus]|uniref:hypothetical protein n=1 Tax=Streptomyces cyaneofuscatus TaxID=66883 RepID=UPI002E159421|nr:hypothetical protein OG366_12230 [Streptomyces cyaneofuscatus]
MLSSEKPSRTVPDRLRAIDWDDDQAASRHAHSRALLMREYLRRAALWAKTYGAEESWPFFDIASAAPFVTLAPTTLDALDAEGEMTYFAKISDGYPRHSPRGIVRRRVEDDGRTHDESFTRNLRWGPTEYLRLYDLGHNDIGHVRITEIEATVFIKSLMEAHRAS